MKRMTVIILAAAILAFGLTGCAAGNFEIQNNNKNAKILKNGNQGTHTNVRRLNREMESDTINQELQNRPGDSYLKDTDTLGN
jgi:outer membrane lipoprotein SlyB